ncbi:MAG: dihydrodipicolinate reductase [Verrucomicrobia bacterium]|nr:dihydrodipicolinate reductase [Verrucomicrobiota bacterium]
MRIALIGYGKMGKAIDALAPEHGVDVVARLGRNWKLSEIEEADVCIEFTTPTSALGNIERVLSAKKPLVVGTTGWSDPHLEQQVASLGGALFFSPNFALGVFLFSQIAKKAGELLSSYPRAGIEIHHSEKADSPSGTAKILSTMVPNLEFSAVRCGSCAGTYTILFDSPGDQITLTHQAKGRTSYALGALAAARYIQNKTGFFTMEDLCNLSL